MTQTQTQPQTQTDVMKCTASEMNPSMDLAIHNYSVLVVWYLDTSLSEKFKSDFRIRDRERQVKILKKLIGQYIFTEGVDQEAFVRFFCRQDTVDYLNALVDAQEAWKIYIEMKKEYDGDIPKEYKDLLEKKMNKLVQLILKSESGRVAKVNGVQKNISSAPGKLKWHEWVTRKDAVWNAAVILCYGAFYDDDPWYLELKNGEKDLEKVARAIRNSDILKHEDHVLLCDRKFLSFWMEHNKTLKKLGDYRVEKLNKSAALRPDDFTTRIKAVNDDQMFEECVQKFCE